MSEPQPNAYALLESSFHASSPLPPYAHPPRRNNDFRDLSHASRPLLIRLETLHTENDTASSVDSRQPTPLEPPRPLTETDSAFPPTPPTLSLDGKVAGSPETQPHPDDIMALVSKQPSFTTPVNARSPPTPDPSPPRSHDSNAVSERPALFAHPSSRAESFTTAKEDLASSNASESRPATPSKDRLSTVEEDRGLGLAFEYSDQDSTPTSRAPPWFPKSEADATTGAEEECKEPLATVHTPEREWDPDLMRNVTIRKKRNPSSSPRKKPNPLSVETSGSPVAGAKGRRSTSLREPVEASSNSPHTPSVENFAQSIGWPPANDNMAEQKQHDVSNKRFSTVSVSSTVVEAMVIMTPPQQRKTLRHSGKNLALRKDGDPSASRASTAFSNRHSMVSDAVPLHRLIHMKASIADRGKRMSVESDTLGLDRNSSPFSTMSGRTTIDSSASTLAHQESIRRVLQPASDILSRSSSVTRSPKLYHTQKSYHLRGSSAPEATTKIKSSGLRNFSEISLAPSPQPAPPTPRQKPMVMQAPKPPLSPVPSQDPISSPRIRRQRRSVADLKQTGHVNKTLPDLPAEPVKKSARQAVLLDISEVPEEKRPPVEPVKKSARQAVLLDISEVPEEKRPPAALLDRVRHLLAERETAGDVAANPAPREVATSSQRAQASPVSQSSSHVRRGSRSSKGRAEEQRYSTYSQDRSTPSQDAHRFSPDQASVEEMFRRSHDVHRRPSEEYKRTSFDRYTARTEEHAMARHLYAQSTPFSQLSDTPIEVSEATAVSIYPHNNHSLLVVQQVPRGNSMVPENRQLMNESPELYYDIRSTPTPPFVDASEDHENQEDYFPPILTVEPSTPPMQIELPQPNGVESPLENPRAPPEPPTIMFIPPTPAEELERQLPPGPPARSDSHPQRRLSLVQRARRYSNDLITPLLSRRGSHARARSPGAHSHTSSHRAPRVPTVNDEDGTLHPFWRPRGFWDGFEDSDSESEEDALPLGGDTSDVEDYESEPEPRGLKRRLTRKLQNSSTAGGGGFLIGNSLGVERSGTNRRRHHVNLPADFSPSRIRKRKSRDDVRYEHSGYGRRTSWRRGRAIPGLKGVQVQYIGLGGVKERWQERTREKRRDKIRKSIGSRYYVEPAGTS